MGGTQSHSATTYATGHLAVADTAHAFFIEKA
jgi:hypothetical protein